MLRGAIQRPIAVSMFFAALMLIGVISAKRLPVDLLPGITYPRLTVVTTQVDIPAEDLERTVTQPLEEVVTALSGVRRVVSRTREGISSITVEYEWGTQMDFANLHLREAIDRVAYRDDFPEDAARPVILRWDPTSRPISILVLQGDEEISTLTEFAEEVVKPGLEQVDGISQAEVVGGSEREIQVRPFLDRLAIYDVSIEDIQGALSRSNISFPGGKIKRGPLSLSLRISGEFESLAEIAETDIPRTSGPPLRIGDVAEVIDTVKEAEGHTLLAGDAVVSLLVYKEPEANTLNVSREMDEALDQLALDYGDFNYDFVYRDADYVEESFMGLLQSLIIGSVLAFGILFFFLRDLRSPLVVGIAIPVSIVITLGVLYFGNVKLNLMSLGGLSLAVGMLVDNAIVVLENINRHLRAGRGEQDDAPQGKFTKLNRRTVAHAVEKGAREMARPVLAATFTTVAVFFPVVYVPGVAGAFFRDQALTVTFSLMVSVATALLLQPVIAARVLSANFEGPKGLFRFFEAIFNGIRNTYHSALERALDHPRIWMALLPVGLLLAGLLLWNLPRSFMPERSSGDLRVELELPSGTSLEETQIVASTFGDWLQQDEAVRAVFSQVGVTEQTLAALKDYAAPHTARVRILLESDKNNRKQSMRVQEKAAARLDKIPGASYTFRDEGIGLGEILSSGEAPFSIGVIADEPWTAVRAAEEIAGHLQNVDGLTDLQVDRVMGSPNLVVNLDREEILRSGLNPDDIARELKNRVSGVEATTFNEVEKRIDIAVRLDRDTRRDLPILLSSPIDVGDGKSVPLRNFIKLTEERPVRELVRRNQRRLVTINGNLSGRSFADVWADADQVIKEIELPNDVMVIHGGDREAVTRSFQDLGWALLLAGVLVYMILAAQFESFLDPLLIAAVIPIGVAGAAIAIWVTGNSINILSLIGAVALLGIAVNDAIVKLDTVRRLREKGVRGKECLLQASTLRFRPILMTSATTILAMIPMAIGLGGGEQLQRPLAITIIGGLFMTTCLTLFYTPIMYLLAHNLEKETSDASESGASLSRELPLEESEA